MTAKQVYKAVLVETQKQKISTMLLEDFNYIFNKAINLYIDKVYKAYDVNQKTTDDLRVLTGTAVLEVKKTDFYTEDFHNSLSGATYECNLPLDYLHLLSCQAVFKVLKDYECYDKDQYFKRPVTRMTADIETQVLDDFYHRPSYRNPYYFLKNVNPNLDLHTNPVQGTKLTREMKGVDGALPRIVDISGKEVSLVEKPAENRYGNASAVRMEIRYGNDDTLFKLEKVYISYLKSPQRIRLTQKQLDLVEDTSQIMEFPDIVCQEIIDGFVALYLENTGDPRVQTQPQITRLVQDSAPSGVANPTASQSPAN